MSIERGAQELEPKDFEAVNENDPVLIAIQEKLNEFLKLSGKTREAAISRYLDLSEKIKSGDQDAYDEVARELGVKKAQMGKQKIASERMKPKEISNQRRDEIEEAWRPDRY